MTTLRSLMDDAWRDAGFASRTLLRTPGFLVAVVSLGLAVGATTAIYGTVDWLLNRPPTGVIEPDRLVAMNLTERERQGEPRTNFNFSHPQFEVLREIQDAFTDVASYGKLLMMAGGDGWTDQVVYQFVTGSYFPLLGVRPLLGRTIRPEDDMEGAEPAVVLSYALWQSRFGGDPDVLGVPIRLQSGEGIVVGVMPRTFEDFHLDWNAPTGLWLPIHTSGTVGMEVMLTAPSTFFPILGRLRPGVDQAEARERAQRWVAQLPPVRIAVIDPNAIRVRPIEDLRISRRDEARSFLSALLVICALILVAASFNVANFFLGRASRRRREIALRTAMGAHPARMVRQLGTEALVLAGATALCAMLVGIWVASMVSTLPNLYLGLPVRAGGIDTAGALDARMLAGAVGMGAVTAFALALLPMLVVFGDPMTEIKGSGPRWSWGRMRPTPRQALMAFQVGLAVALSVTAALYAQAFLNATRVDPEYADPETLFFARIVSTEEPRGDFSVFYDALLERVRAAPWAVSAGLAYNQPYAGGIGTAAHVGDRSGAFDVNGANLTPGLLATLGVPLVGGRDVQDDDGRDVVIVNQTLARRLWPDETAVDKRFDYVGETVRVIGVVARERCLDLLAEPDGCVWRMVSPGGDTRTIYVRTGGRADEAIAPFRALVAELDARMAIVEAHSLQSFLDERIRAERISAVASSALALFGIAVLVVGCVSLFVSMVQDSLREIAIRMALGATHRRIIATVVSRGLLISVLGSVFGLAASAAVAHRLAGQFYGVSPTDLPTFIAIAGLILVVAVTAVGYSARTAARTDPAEHLQND